jgi:hypothetical protein
MDRRSKERLEHERDRTIKNVDREIEHLDFSYAKMIREKDLLAQRTYRLFEGDSSDFQRLMARLEMNNAEFEKFLRRKQRYLELEKLEAKREFEKKIRQ